MYTCLYTHYITLCTHVYIHTIKAYPNTLIYSPYKPTIYLLYKGTPHTPPSRCPPIPLLTLSLWVYYEPMLLELWKHSPWPSPHDGTGVTLCPMLPLLRARGVAQPLPAHTFINPLAMGIL